MNKLAQISAITMAAGFATAGSLDLDRSYAAEMRADAGARSVLNSQDNAVTVSAGVRFGYGINLRDGDALGDDDTTIGFGFNEVEVRVSGDITDNMRGTVSFDFGPNDGVDDDDDGDADPATGNNVNLEDAYATWMINDGFSLQIGQYVPAFSAEASTSEFHMMNVFRSLTHEQLGTPSWTQGVQGNFGGDTWSGSLGFNDGPGSWNSPFNSDDEADYGFNARFDFFSDSDKDRFMDQTSWRGSASGWRIGAGAMYATSGETNPSVGTDSDALFYTIDGAYEGDGWAVHAAFYGASVSPEVGDDTDDFGFEVGGSIFFDDQWEGFARWDTIMVDDANLSPAEEDTYSFLAAGVNYYFVPESHAAKLTAAVGYSFEATTGPEGVFDGDFTAPTGITGFGQSGFLGDTEEGEIQFNVNMQFLF